MIRSSVVALLRSQNPVSLPRLAQHPFLNDSLVLLLSLNPLCAVVSTREWLPPFSICFLFVLPPMRECRQRGGRIFPCLASLDGIVSSAGVPVSPTVSPSELTKACGQSQIDTAFLSFHARMHTQRHPGMDEYCGRSGEFMNVFDGATLAERGLSPQRKTLCVD